jgi:predicted TIM-barrel fold metal-dependent hydrolase
VVTEYRYVSADQHLDLLWTPPDLFTSRVPARFAEAAPKVVDTDEGARWSWEGKLWGPSASKGTPGSTTVAPGVLGESALVAVADEIPVGVLPPSDAGVLLDHMDRAGIWAWTIYGPTRKMQFDDPELALACNTAWNDFMLEFSAAAPGRIIGLPNIPTWDPAAAVVEAKRVIAAGAKGVEFSVFGVEPVWSPVWEPLWSVAEEAGVPIGMHIGAKPGEPYPPNEHGRYPAHFCLSPFAHQRSMAELVFSGALDRHPGLKVVFAECRVGWLSFFIEHMDRQQRERRTDVKLQLKPSEYWARQLAATWEDDKIGAELLKHDWSHLQHVTMWGCDYPHNPVTWPHTDQLMSWLIAGVPEDVARDALYGRACQFYNLQMPTSVPLPTTPLDTAAAAS